MHNVHVLITLPLRGGPSIEYFADQTGFHKLSQFLLDNSEHFINTIEAPEKVSTGLRQVPVNKCFIYVVTSAAGANIFYSSSAAERFYQIERVSSGREVILSRHAIRLDMTFTDEDDLRNYCILDAAPVVIKSGGQR